MKLTTIGNSTSLLDVSIVKHLNFILKQNIAIENTEKCDIIHIKDLPNTKIFIHKFNQAPNVKSITIHNNKQVSKHLYSPLNFKYINIDLSEIIDKLFIETMATDKELNNINTIFFKNKQCPICNSKNLQNHKHSDNLLFIECSNKCYSIKTKSCDLIHGNIKLYNHKPIIIYQTDSLEEKLNKLEEISKMIYNYKHNDKYLAEILERGN